MITAGPNVNTLGSSPFPFTLTEIVLSSAEIDSTVPLTVAAITCVAANETSPKTTAPTKARLNINLSVGVTEVNRETIPHTVAEIPRIRPLMPGE